MKKLSEFAVAFIELLEAEGRLLKERTFAVVLAILLAIATVCVALAALYFFSRSFFIYLSGMMGEIYASLVLACVLSVITGLLAWRTKKMLS